MHGPWFVDFLLRNFGQSPVKVCYSAIIPTTGNAKNHLEDQQLFVPPAAPHIGLP